MYLAGVPVRDEVVLDLARLLRDGGFDDTAEALVVALEAEQAIVALTIQVERRSCAPSTIHPKGSSSCAGCCCRSTSGAFEMDCSELERVSSEQEEREIAWSCGSG